MNWVIVTGESGGLGGKITEVLLENSEFGVIGISRSAQGRPAEFRERFGDRFVHLDYDLSDPSGIKELYLQKIKPIGTVTGLVNNSAWAYDDLVTNANVEPLERMFNINVLSAIMLSKYTIRDMILNGVKGSLVHISSVSAHTGFKGLSMYAATKGALEAFSKGAAREWGHKGIRSNCVAPGFMETAMSGSLSDELRVKIYRRNSLPGPTDLASTAHTVAFLLSDRAGSITGTTIRVDNGAL
jgi:3-oxoacyl-[acyl-carrier protein] reductase